MKGFKTFLIVLLLIKIVKFILSLTKFKKRSDIFLFFNGKEQNYQDKNFDSTSICIFFSGMELDLREATIGDEPVTLDITGRFSGFSIKINPEWNVTLEGTASKSGILDESK